MTGLLKEQLREVFATKGTNGKRLLAGWLSWARRSRLPGFVKLAKTLTRFLPLIHNTLKHRLGNARSEATNTHLRLLTRRAYGFHSAEALIAMANSPAVDSAHHYPDDHENPPTETSVDPERVGVSNRTKSRMDAVEWSHEQVG